MNVQQRPLRRLSPARVSVRISASTWLTAVSVAGSAEQQSLISSFERLYANSSTTCQTTLRNRVLAVRKKQVAMNVLD